MAEASYLMYRGRLNEATGVEALETRRIGNVVIVERATDPLAPYGVRKLTLDLADHPDPEVERLGVGIVHPVHAHAASAPEEDHVP